MSHENRRHEIATKSVVYRISETDAVKVQHDVPYAVVDGEQLTLDIYVPAEHTSETRTPAVLFVTGFRDEGMRRFVGCNAKEMESYISWAKLVAASGLVAITYTNRKPDTDVHDVLRYVRQHAASLGIDEQRIGIWACSGNAPNGLAVVMDAQPRVTCAVLCYGFMLDLDGSTFVADAARALRFANPCAGRLLEDLPTNLPLLIARAGRDEFPHLNDTIDRFVAKALALNLPVTLINHDTAPHAFDISDDTEMSRELVRQILAFMRFHLLTADIASRMGDHRMG